MKKKKKNKDYADIQKMLEDNEYISKTKKVVRKTNLYSNIYIPPRPYVEITDVESADLYS